MSKIIYPLSADPITLGHIDIIKRVIRLFPKSEIDIVIANNENKKHLFNIEERLRIAESSFENIKENINVVSYKGVISNYANENGATVMIRGIRNSTDFDYEINLEQFTRATSEMETIYLSPYTKHLNTSSSLVRNFILSENVDKAEAFMDEKGYKALVSILNKRTKFYFER